MPTAKKRILLGIINVINELILIINIKLFNYVRPEKRKDFIRKLWLNSQKELEIFIKK